MKLNPAVFDLWVFRRTPSDPQYLLLHTSELKAERYFNGGRFWQIPSGVFRDGETVPAAVDRELAGYGLRAGGIWAAEHAYTIYNRRFHEIQIISVFAAEVGGGEPRLDPAEHGAAGWFSYEAALAAVHYRGLKEGLRSVREYVTGPAGAAPELCLRGQRS
jgi:ADP-ribose pyrophosphatase YjhB (NUDIX family)